MSSGLVSVETSLTVCQSHCLLFSTISFEKLSSITISLSRGLRLFSVKKVINLRSHKSPVLPFWRLNVLFQTLNVNPLNRFLHQNLRCTFPTLKFVGKLLEYLDFELNDALSFFNAELIPMNFPIRFYFLITRILDASRWKYFKYLFKINVQIF